MNNRYAVYGNPIEQSQSPVIHMLFAEQMGETIDYQRELIEIGHFQQRASEFFAGGGAGLNVTLPFKLEAHDLADQLTERAKLAGAVNTLYLRKNHICGDNTDGVGLCSDIADNLGWRLNEARVLVLGAGGAVRGVILPLLQNKISSLTIANRTVSKAQQLVAEFNDFSNNTSLTAAEFSDIDGQYDIVINGTSASLSGSLPPLQAKVVCGANCYDMVYGAEPTEFLNWCEGAGANHVADGLGMLVEQAAESFYIWRGIRPNTQPVIESLRKRLVNA